MWVSRGKKSELTEREVLKQTSLLNIYHWLINAQNWKSFSRISLFKWGQSRMCYRIHVLKSHWHRFCAEVIFFSLNSELNLLLHKAIQIKDQVETTTMSGGGRGANESRTRETSHGGVLWLSVSHPRLSQCSLFPHSHSYCPFSSTGWRAASKVPGD